MRSVRIALEARLYQMQECFVEMVIKDDWTIELRTDGAIGKEWLLVQAITNKNGVVVGVAAIMSLQRRVSTGQTRLGVGCR